MSDILCITNRLLCSENFLMRLEKIAAAGPAGIILREKELTREQYADLARQVIPICEAYHVPCILHSFIDTAISLNADAIHLPMSLLRKMTETQKAYFGTIGASCHSAQEACEAEALGSTYITAGHIFATDCKKGIPGRGIHFLKTICESTSLPVYAIGGIDSNNIMSVRNAGADGVCLMSSLMQCDNVPLLMKNLKKAGVTNEI